jgi:hypothetical protein
MHARESRLDGHQLPLRLTLREVVHVIILWCDREQPTMRTDTS